MIASPAENQTGLGSGHFTSVSILIGGATGGAVAISCEI
jgi:hypothetical protein